jgi:hypothetical protein
MWRKKEEESKGFIPAGFSIFCFFIACSDEKHIAFVNRKEAFSFFPCSC